MPHSRDPHSQAAEAPVESAGEARVAMLRSGDHGWILLRPNRSLGRNGLTLSAALCLGALIPAISMAVLLGAWPMLPFLGLEALVVVAVFLWLARHQDDHERVLLDAERILHVRVDGQRREARSFPRYWARLVVEPGTGRMQVPRLWLRSHGQSAELGRDGSVMTRHALARTLTDEFGILRSPARPV